MTNRISLTSVLGFARSALLVAALPGCVWITEAEWQAFNDRDGDGLDHASDCDDGNKAVQGTVKWYPDVDGDGFGDMDAQPVERCQNDPPAGHVNDNTDCDDGEEAVHPGGTELCDNLNLDEDCNGAADDADNAAEGKVMWFVDADGDSYGDELDPGELACDPPTGTEVEDNTDCDDDNATAHPGGDEVCDPNNVDEDCSGLADDADPGVDPATRIQYYDDADGDGYGNPAVPGLLQCDRPGSQADNNGDCNDALASVNPGETEICDPADVDEDCDGQRDDDDASVDPATMSIWYPDDDDDGFGDDSVGGALRCDPLANEVADHTDCDDSRDDINPNGSEVCDAGTDDEDCNGLFNEFDPGAALSAWYPDNDGDGYGNDSVPPAQITCNGPPNTVTDNTDCDDTDDTIHPGAHERHDGVDSDCDVAASDYVCGQAYMRVYPVGQGGADADFNSIQAAVNAFDQVIWCDGDTIEVTPGDYNENVTISGGARGMPGSKNPNVVGLLGPASTTIRGTGTGRVVEIANGEQIEFRGFTITGGNVTGDGGGLRLFYGSGILLDDLVVTGNTASGNGGGIEVRHPKGHTISNSEVTGNTANGGIDGGGGIRLSGTSANVSGTTVLTGLLVDGNTAFNNGGGVFVDLDLGPATVRIEDSTISYNTGVNGAGLYALDATALSLTRVDVIGNDASSSTGGVYATATPIVMTDVYFSGNRGPTLAAVQLLNMNSGGVTLTDVTLVDNVLEQINGYTMLLKGNATHGATLRRVEVARTLHLVGGVPIWGAGIAAEGKLDAKNLLIYDESGYAGLYTIEGLDGLPTTTSIANSTIVGCDNDGIVLANATTSGLTLDGVISANNGGYGVRQSLLTAAVTNGDVYGNTAGAFFGSNPTGTNGNISVDPMFVSYNGAALSQTWNLDLAAGSPCIDTGNAALTDPDGTRADMGAYGGPNAY